RLRMEPRQGRGAVAVRPLHGVVLAQRRTTAGARSRRLDTRRPSARSLPAPVAQGALGQCAGEVMATRAVILLSGGLDSATVLALARESGLDCHALSVSYGQRHQAELNAAARVAHAQGAREHRIMHVDLGRIGGSALTDKSIDVPAAGGEGIPV